MDLLATISSWSLYCPERPAYISADGVLSWRDLLARSDAIAAFLETEVVAGERVVAFGHKEIGLLPCFLGCAKSGHAYVPLDSSLPPERARRIIADSGAPLVLASVEVPPEALPSGVSTASERDVAATYAGRTPDAASRPKSGDDVYVIYTSGSTGDPKGVRITLGALASFVEWMLAEQQPRQADEVFLNQAPFSFDLSVMDLYMSLATGGTLWSVDRDMITEPARMFDGLARSDISAWVSTPSFAEMCLAEPSFSSQMLPRLQRFLFDGEILPNDLVSRLFERFPAASVWNLYGPTESTVAITSIEITPEILATYRPLPIGRAKPGSRVLLDEGGHLNPDDGAGEIVIVGPTVSVGYLGKHELTRQRFFVDEPSGQRAYRTGDAGHREGGLLFYDGRRDFQVKLHGYRIELGDVEANICRLPEVANVVVLPVVRNGRAEYLQAHVLLAQRLPGTDLERAAYLRSQLVQFLPEYMVPRRFVFPDGFPMTSNGKIDRAALEARRT